MQHQMEGRMSKQNEWEKLIHAAWTDPSLLKDPIYKIAVEATIEQLDQGQVRVSEYQSALDQWITIEWVKKSVLLYFKICENVEMSSGPLNFRDKIPIKSNLEKSGVRVVPPGAARYGSYLAPGVVLMPGYVNIGAWVDEGTMVDTWATVGSCAQIGKRVHLSGGVGIGGVLEPIQAQPVVVEDDCFIGSRCILVEGVRIGRGSVLGAGLTLTQTTPIIDVTGASEVVYKGYVPPGSVVIPGSQPKKFPSGTYSVPCALIVKKVDEQTRSKTTLNDLLRDFPLNL
jgi:2,3,4,5-tetrahydropyridine-2-carboxylate N-succinyltransferase